VCLRVVFQNGYNGCIYHYRHIYQIAHTVIMVDNTILGKIIGLHVVFQNGYNGCIYHYRRIYRNTHTVIMVDNTIMGKITGFLGKTR
jgi:hypothetical protein